MPHRTSVTLRFSCAECLDLGAGFSISSTEVHKGKLSTNLSHLTRSSINKIVFLIFIKVCGLNILQIDEKGLILDF